MADLAYTANRIAILGKKVTFTKRYSSEVAVSLDGVEIGHLDNVVGPQVAAAMDRGQSFTVFVKEARPNYSADFNQSVDGFT